REVLANEACDLILVLQRIAAGNHATCAVTEQIHRQARLARFHEVDERREILRPVRELLYEESLAFRAAMAALIQAVDRKPIGGELLGGPLVKTTLRIQSMGDDDHAARPAGRLPLAREDPDAVDAFETCFNRFHEFAPQNGKPCVALAMHSTNGTDRMK